MELIATALGDDVYSAARAAAVFSRKAVRDHCHFLHRGERDAAEQRLAAPTIVASTAVHFEPGLAPSGSVGGEEILVREDVALVNGRTVGCVQQRQKSDPAVEQGRLFHLA